MADFATLPEAFQAQVLAFPERPALRSSDDKIRLTWREYGDEVRRVAGGLAALGLARGDTFAALLTNRPEFNITEAAASHLGATTFSMYNTSSPEQINHLLTHSGTRFLVTETRYLESIKASGARIEHLLVVEDGDIDALAPSAGFDFESAWRAVTPDDLLCLIYTSGTTGPPKGVEHTHRGTMAMAEAVTEFYPAESTDRMISYLPSAHAADRYFTHYFAQLRGFETVTLDDPQNLLPVLQQVRPTIFVAVPRIWQKLRIGIELQLHANDELRAAFEADAPGVRAAIREKVGLDGLRWALSGAAAIAPDDFSFLQRLGLPVSEIWGMSECGLGTGAPPSEARQGTVGRAPRGTELRVVSDGELLLRGPSIMKGYRNDPVQTAEAIDEEGWLHSGDIATLDEDGFVRIVDRKKELIINAGGKNMSPSNIEHAISTASTLIGNVVAIGDGRPYNVALITLDPDGARAFAASNGLDPDPHTLTTNPRVLQAIQAAVDAGNAKLSRIEQIKRFALLPSFWEPGGAELTPTSKLKRRPISEKYAQQIEDLYTRS